MGVRIDPARDHVGAAGIDDLGAGRRIQLFADGYDLPLVAEHVRPQALVRIDHRSAAHPAMP